MSLPVRSRRSHESHSSAPRRHTVGGTFKPTSGTSGSGTFSHIQVVPQESAERSRPSDPEIAVQKPSFGQDAEREMAMYRGPLGAPTASLANLTSGTTFAAKARAAELNAVRARRAATALEIGKESVDEVPPLQPVALGAVKFTMPRNRGAKAWKPLNLNELPEHSSEEGSQTSINRPPTAQSLVTSSGYSEEQRPADGKRALNYGNLATSHNLLPNTLTQGPFLTQYQYQYPASIQMADQSAVNPFSREWDPAMPVFNSSHVPSAMLSNEGHPLRAGNQFGHQYNPYPAAAQPLASQAGNAYNSIMKPLSNDDPFTDQPKVNKQPGPVAQFVSKPPGLHPSTAAHKQPAAVKGTMDHGFRFPQGIPQTLLPYLNTQTSQALEQPLTAPKASVPTAKPNPSTPSSNTYARDPKPYTSFSASKKEMLLQNLEQVVESSKAKGDLPSATRTVLYDPYASDPAGPSQPSYPNAYGKLNQAEKESLKVSEPIDWQERTAPIFTSPTACSFEESQAPQFPPGLSAGNEYIYSLAQPPKPATRSLADVEAWWNNDTRAQGVHRAAMTELDNALFSKDPPGHRTTSESFGSLTSPASNKTGGSMAPIGSERSAKGNNANNELAEMMKQVCVNLESYVVPSDKPQDDYFGRFARVPEWCIDKSPSGNDSFFGDWGVPPSRVGRDPRYRPTFHEGRYTVFEELGRGSGRDGGLGRRYH